MAYNTDLQSNNAELEEILETVNTLPDAGNGGSSGPHEHDWYDINNAPFTGMTGDTLIWDGDTTDREVVNTYYYKVSDCTPSYEELLKGVSFYYKARSTGAEYPYDTAITIYDNTDSDGYCYVSGSKTNMLYVYYEGNTAGVTPGIYLYSNSVMCYSRLIITDYTGFEPISTLKDEALNPVAQYVGAPTVAYSSYYYIPIPRVDKYGRVISIGGSYLYPATITRKGYIEASAYANLPVIKSSAERVILAGSTETQYDFYLNLTSNIDILPVVYAYGEYTDADGYKHIINCDWDIKYTESSTSSRAYYLSGKIAEPIEYDLTVHVISNHQWIYSM